MLVRCAIIMGLSKSRGPSIDSSWRGMRVVKNIHHAGVDYKTFIDTLRSIARLIAVVTTSLYEALIEQAGSLE